MLTQIPSGDLDLGSEKISLSEKSKWKRKEGKKRTAGEFFYRGLLFGKNLVECDSSRGDRSIFNFYWVG